MIGVHTRALTQPKWTPARSPVLARERVPLELVHVPYAAYDKHWDCLQYAVDNKCPEWEEYAKKYANHLR